MLARDGWHRASSVVASRVVERYHRPRFCQCRGGGEGAVASRVPSHDAPRAARLTSPRFGGHRHAAGLTLIRWVEAFRAAFEGHAREKLAEDDLVPRCRIEGWLGSGQISERTAHALEQLAPFGAGHPEPIFALRGRAGRARPVGASGAHLKTELHGVEAIGFSLGDRLPLCAGEIEAAVSVGFDEWDGRRRLQLRIRDLRRATS
jgi:single-stranded-DNA-specific exonuclease